MSICVLPNGKVYFALVLSFCLSLCVGVAVHATTPDGVWEGTVAPEPDEHQEWHLMLANGRITGAAVVFYQDGGEETLPFRGTYTVSESKVTLNLEVENDGTWNSWPVSGTLSADGTRMSLAGVVDDNPGVSFELVRLGSPPPPGPSPSPPLTAADGIWEGVVTPEIDEIQEWLLILDNERILGSAAVYYGDGGQESLPFRGTYTVSESKITLNLEVEDDGRWVAWPVSGSISPNGTMMSLAGVVDGRPGVSFQLFRSGSPPAPEPTPTPTPATEPQEPTATPTETPALYPEPWRPWRVFTMDSADEFTRYPGGFDENPPGSVAVGNIPPGGPLLTDGKGVSIITAPGQLELLLFPTLDVGDNLVFMRASVQSVGKKAAVALAVLDGSMDGSIATNIPANSAIFEGGYDRMVLLYDPPGSTVIPVFQVANLAGDENVLVYLDNLEIYLLPKEGSVPNALLHGD